MNDELFATVGFGLNLLNMRRYTIPIFHLKDFKSPFTFTAQSNNLHNKYQQLLYNMFMMFNTTIH